MKCVILVSLALVALTNAIPNDEVLQKWTDFQAKFGKVYKSPVESRKRLNIFKENLETIEAHNTMFDEGKVSYTLGINQFADWTSEEFMQYVRKGLTNKPKSGTRSQIFKASENFTLPESVDWRNDGIVTGAKDQGQCGSCWSFSTTGSLEGQLAKKTGQLISLSEQNLVDCSWPEGNMGCNGGLMTAGFEYVMENGIEKENDYPYTSFDGSCKAKPDKVVTKISSYVEILEYDEDALQQAIATIGPISVAIDATNNMQMYRSGILDDNSCSSYNLDHGVTAVGYGSENGKEFYIIKNSWGANWGENGYVRMLKKNNRCGIASMASYPVM